MLRTAVHARDPGHARGGALIRLLLLLIIVLAVVLVVRGLAVGSMQPEASSHRATAC